MSKLSAIVVCFNEADNIGPCLESLRWAEEIVVVDSFSTDKTPEIARQYTDRVLQREFDGYASQRNWALSQTASPWVLMVDADERISPELRQELEHLIEKPEAPEAYKIRRRNFFAGREIRYCGWQRDWVLRLFKRDKAAYKETRLHESVHVEGRVGRCQAAMVHYPYKNLDEYLQKLRRYADLGGQDAAQAGKHAGFFRLFFHPLGRFLRMYLLQKGFLDGLHGLIICLLAACYVTMQDVRLWELENLPEDIS